ncbi:hypothetical protein [Prescottella agglutinans]|uniref:hypothetical protein n=1 Tax=Prescottella agglutinans TaxID=1644129 RepID=UPI003D994AB0
MPFLPITKNAPGAAGTATEGTENRTNTQEGTDSPVTLSNAARPNDFIVSEIASCEVVDMSVDTENGLDAALEYNVETDELGEVENSYYRVVFTAHAGNTTSMLQISPHKIPQFVHALNELHEEWIRDTKRSGLRGITVETVFLDAQARGMKVTDVLAEVLEQLGIDDLKAV